jgi:MinD-like ATPase involved in chromosome partitioning or flagellar assembly
VTDGDRYVVLGLARVRAPWFRDVARWATSAALPVDFVKVVSGEEARARLRSGRPFSALLVDGGLAALDRDLVELAWQHGCVVIAVDDGRSVRSWRELGVHAVLPAGFEREQLLDGLRAVARPLSRGDELAMPAMQTTADPPGAWRGRLVAVTGAGGVGRSTLAMALAAGLAADPRDRGLVLLADLALHGHQALLNDAGDVVPGLSELVEAHRAAALPAPQVRALCFTVPDRGYDLLIGLRRHRDWTALRPRAVDAALQALRGAYRVVVADVDADVEGEEQCGSVEVEDRNALARHTLRDADLVLVVGLPGIAGVHSQLRVTRDALELGVAGDRIVPVVNRAPRNPRVRAEAGMAYARLLTATNPGVMLASSPVHLPERRRVAELLRDNAAPPAPLIRPLTGAVRGLLDVAPRRPGRAGAGAEPVPVAPGSLGSWYDDHDEAVEA